MSYNPLYPIPMEQAGILQGGPNYLGSHGVAEGGGMNYGSGIGYIPSNAMASLGQAGNSYMGPLGQLDLTAFTNMVPGATGVVDSLSQSTGIDVAALPGTALKVASEVQRQQQAADIAKKQGPAAASAFLQQTAPGAQPAKSTNWGLIIGGVVVVGGLIFFMTRKKS